MILDVVAQELGWLHISDPVITRHPHPSPSSLNTICSPLHLFFFLLADSSSSFHAFPSNQLVNVALKWIDTFVVEPLWFDEDFYGIPLVTASGVPQ